MVKSCFDKLSIVSLSNYWVFCLLKTQPNLMCKNFNFVLITPLSACGHAQAGVNKTLPARTPACPPVYPSERHGRAGAFRQPDKTVLAGTGTYSGRFGQVPFGTGGKGKIQEGVKALAF